MEDPTQPIPYSRRLGGEQSYWTMGYLMTWLAEAKDTDGRFSMVDVVAPKGTEPPPHTHSREDEGYYILEGEFTFQVGAQTIETRPGDYVFLPRGVQHAPQLKTPEGRALIVITPAGLEEAFKRLSEPARTPTLPPPPEEPPNIEEILALFGEYGVEFAPPPPPL